MGNEMEWKWNEKGAMRIGKRGEIEKEKLTYKKILLTWQEGVLVD
jgi:hypothetical protein